MQLLSAPKKGAHGAFITPTRQPGTSKAQGLRSMQAPLPETPVLQQEQAPLILQPVVAPGVEVAHVQPACPAIMAPNAALSQATPPTRDCSTQTSESILFPVGQLGKTPARGDGVRVEVVRVPDGTRQNVLQRLKDFPGQHFSVTASGELFCNACHETLDEKKSTVQDHVKSKKHAKNKEGHEKGV